VLRAGGSLVSGGSEVVRQSLYFIVDLLLLLGVFAAHAQNHEALGRWGAAGFLTTVAGILLSRAVSALTCIRRGQIEPALFVASGVIFGAAMLEVGRQVLRAATAAPRNEAPGIIPRSAIH